MVRGHDVFLDTRAVVLADTTVWLTLPISMPRVMDADDQTGGVVVGEPKFTVDQPPKIQIGRLALSRPVPANSVFVTVNPVFSDVTHRSEPSR